MEKKKSFRTNRIFQVLYPILVYFVLYQFSAVLFMGVVPKNLGRLFALFLAAWITYPFILRIYRKAVIVKNPVQFSKKDFKLDFGLILLIVIIGVALNIIISKTPLVDMSNAYKSANSELFDGPIWVKIITNCMMIPLLEETLYRGIIALQIDLWYGRVPAILISALLFGAFHFNLVQLLYACCIGLLLGYAITKTHKLWVCALAHGLLNFIVVLVSIFS